MTRAEKLAKAFYNQCQAEKAGGLVVYDGKDKVSVGVAGDGANIMTMLATAIIHAAHGDKNAVIEITAALAAMTVNPNKRTDDLYDKIIKILKEHCIQNHATF